MKVILKSRKIVSKTNKWKFLLAVFFGFPIHNKESYSVYHNKKLSKKSKEYTVKKIIDTKTNSKFIKESQKIKF
jgi:hypothetical protein